jgi:hypothetical protein
VSRALATVCLVLVSLLGCDVSTSRQAAVVGAIVEGDLAFSRSRPALLEGKYARMARDVYAYYRGSLAVYRADVRDPSTGIGTTRFRADGVLPLSLGDPHPENFGLLQGPDRTLALEPNDFDAADRYPYTWDLRRLTVGMVLAVRASNQGDEDARSRAVAASALVVDSTVRGYADALHELAAGAAPARVDTDLGQTVLTDLFRRGLRDAAARAELGALTVLEDDGVRRFRLGVLDPAEPEHARQRGERGGAQLRRQSSRLGKRPEIFALTIWRRTACSVLLSTSPTPNRPITTGTMPSPSTKGANSKVRRCWALMVSSPTKPSTIPTQAMKSALTIEPCVRKVSIVRPSTIRLTYSAGPNASA